MEITNLTSDTYHILGRHTLSPSATITIANEEYGNPSIRDAINNLYSSGKISVEGEPDEFPIEGSEGYITDPTNKEDGDAIIWNSETKEWESSSRHLAKFTIYEELSSDPYILEMNTSGKPGIGIYAEYITDECENPGGPDLYISAFTRITNRPWGVTTSYDGDQIGIYQQFASLNAVPMIKTFSIMGFATMSNIVVIPADEAGDVNEASAQDPTENLTYGFQFQLRKLGNLFSVEAVDPGVPNSPLSVSSPTGWDIIINLATDEDGEITTLAHHISTILSYTLVNASFDTFDEIAQPHEKVLFSGGTSGDPKITYRLSNEI